MLLSGKFVVMLYDSCIRISETVVILHLKPALPNPPNPHHRVHLRVQTQDVSWRRSDIYERANTQLWSCISENALETLNTSSAAAVVSPVILYLQHP